MAEVTASAVKSLREKSGAGMVDCKNALVEANGDEAAAIEILRKKGMATAGKKAGRVTAEGAVGSYIHMGGKVGVLVEINCESDFVSRGEEFQQLVKDVAMHIAASDPRWATRDEVPAAELDKEREIMREQLKNDAKNANKPEDVLNKIIEGRLNKFFEDNISQPKGGTAPAPVKGGVSRLRVKYITQGGMRPPLFVLFTAGGSKAGLHFSYLRYIENRLRDEFEFYATPIRIKERRKDASRSARP